MKPEILKAVAEGAQQIVAETDGRSDALQYAETLANDVNADLQLGYDKDSDGYGVLFKACYSAIWDAAK